MLASARMPDWSTLLVFGLASLALVAIPGPNVIYIATRSLGQGRRVGVASALGVETGALVHIAAATAGLWALIRSSPLAFDVVKYLGAAYLIGLGIRALVRGQALDLDGRTTAEPLRRAYSEGILVNVLNPKVALFFVAFLPQFVDPARGAPAVQILVLGLVSCHRGRARPRLGARGRDARRLAGARGPGSRTGSASSREASTWRSEPRRR